MPRSKQSTHLKHIDRRFLAKVAHFRYVIGMKQAEIAKALKMKQPTVSRLLQVCEQRGVVTHRIDADFAIYGNEIEYLAGELLAGFSLEKALVIHMPPVADAGGEAHASDDDLHIALANHTGRRIIREHRLHNGDHIAVAGGRAVVRLAHVIAAHPPSCRDIVVTPLGGRLWSGLLLAAETHGPAHLEQPLNPDYSALILAVGIHAGHEPGIRFSQVSNPLYAGTRRKAHEIMSANCAFLPKGRWNEEWKLQPPTKAFVGVGVVDPESSHRIAEYIRGDGSAPKRRMPAPYDAISKQLGHVKASGLPYFGDVANRLFAALPIVADAGSVLSGAAIPSDCSPADLASYTSKYTPLIRSLDEINSKSVVMEWDHLRSIPSVLGLAAGFRKLNVLWTLLVAGLTGHPRILDELSTDEDTATHLIAIHGQYEHATPAVKEWFKTMSEKIFASSAVARSRH
jgi:DNA-binding transcriptional regulator LsrR (DeoR family)